MKNQTAQNCINEQFSTDLNLNQPNDEEYYKDADFSRRFDNLNQS